MNSVTAYQEGDTVEIVAQSGINLRGLRDGQTLLLVPKGSQIRVDQLKVQSSDQQVFVKTSFQGSEGFLYAGHLLPQKTFSQWMIPVPSPAQNLVSLKSNKAYGFLRECAGYSCEKKVAIIRSFGSAPQMQILKRQGSWIFVRSSELDEEGWMTESEVEEVHLE